ncbi:MAG: hypothetical protein KF812_02645 [Fimbriimonadaceae bacterium]|nr:hypothetical protein [Fimbriimonadaceae bacterium]
MMRLNIRLVLVALTVTTVSAIATPATGDKWTVAGWPQFDGTWLFDHTEGTSGLTNPRSLKIGGNVASLMLSGMDYDSQGRLLAITSSGFYEVAPTTGELTLRGAFGVGIEGAASYDPVGNRFLIAAGFGGIEEVDLVNFNRNLISPLTGIDDVSGIAVGSNGQIWILASNTNSSSIAELYELQGNTPVSYGLLGIPVSGAIAGFDVDSNGELTLTSGNSLYRVNPVFGTPTVSMVSSLAGPSDYSGLTFNAVPEPSFGLLAALVLMPLIRRRHKLAI